MPSASDFITGALQDLGVLGAGQAASAADAADAFTLLNQIADAMGIERLLLYQILRTVVPLTASTASYTIGSGGTINIVRPTWIDHATVIPDDTASAPAEIPIDLLSESEYAAWSPKAQTGQPRAVYYNYAWTAGLGTITPLPVPSDSDQAMVLYTPAAPVTTFAALATSYTFPPGFARAIRKTLALEIAPMFHATPSSLLLKQQSEAVTVLKRAQDRPEPLRYDAALTAGQGAGGWDITSGTWRP